MLAALLFQHRRHLGGGLGRLPEEGSSRAGLSGRSVRFHHRGRALGRQKPGGCSRQVGLHSNKHPFRGHMTGKGWVNLNLVSASKCLVTLRESAEREGSLEMGPQVRSGV